MLTNFHIGGTERQVANLALGIDPSHFDLHLACLRHSGELLAELETLRVPRPEFPIGPLYSSEDALAGYPPGSLHSIQLDPDRPQLRFLSRISSQFLSPGWPGHRSWWPPSATRATC